MYITNKNYAIPKYSIRKKERAEPRAAYNLTPCSIQKLMPSQWNCLIDWWHDVNSTQCIGWSGEREIHPRDVTLLGYFPSHEVTREITKKCHVKWVNFPFATTEYTLFISYMAINEHCWVKSPLTHLSYILILGFSVVLRRCCFSKTPLCGVISRLCCDVTPRHQGILWRQTFVTSIARAKPYLTCEI